MGIGRVPLPDPTTAVGGLKPCRLRAGQPLFDSRRRKLATPGTLNGVPPEFAGLVIRVRT